MAGEVEQQISNQASKTSQEFKRITDEKGEEITRDARETMQKFTDLLRDNIPDEKQGQDFARVLSEFRTSWEGQERQNWSVITSLMDGFSSLGTKYEAAQRQINEIQAQIRSVPNS